MKESTKALKLIQALINNLLHKDMICQIDHYPYSYQVLLLCNIMLKLIQDNIELTTQSQRLLKYISYDLIDYADALDLFNNQPKSYTNLHIEQEVTEILNGLNANKR